jgi:hypothetical protein
LGGKGEWAAAKVTPRRTPVIDGELDIACLGMLRVLVARLEVLVCETWALDFAEGGWNAHP